MSNDLNKHEISGGELKGASDYAPGYVVNWRKWGLGFSVEFGDPAVLRLWLGPVRSGWKWGRNV